MSEASYLHSELDKKPEPRWGYAEMICKLCRGLGCKGCGHTGYTIVHIPDAPPGWEKLEQLEFDTRLPALVQMTNAELNARVEGWVGEKPLSGVGDR